MRSKKEVLEKTSDQFLQMPLAEEKNMFAIVSVTHLANLVKGCVEERFGAVHVEGEVSMPKLHSSGHLYFTLKDEKATLDIVCWRPLAARLAPLVVHGNKIVCKGRLTTYGGRSKYQMILEEVQVSGQGNLHALFQQRKEKLRQEGLFEALRKRALPVFPSCVGVITSPTGAVIQDILHRLKERFPCNVLVFPTPVQGDDAARKIEEGLHIMQAVVPCPDVIIIARGGGSFEDLWPFNDEALVRAVASSTIPVVTAVGHETDTTLVDFAADKRAPTPTAAAEMVTPQKEQLYKELLHQKQRLRNMLDSLFEKQRLQVQVLMRGFMRAEAFLHTFTQRCDEACLGLEKAGAKWDTLAHRLQLLKGRLRHPKDLEKAVRIALNNATKRLTFGMNYLLKQSSEQLHNKHQQLDMLSFKNTLKRGFCMAKNNKGTLLKTAEASVQEESFHVVFSDGTLSVRTPAKVPAS